MPRSSKKAAQAFYEAEEALKDAEVAIFLLLNTVFERRLKTHSAFRQIKEEPLSPEAYVALVNDLCLKVATDPEYPKTPEAFVQSYQDQALWQHHLALAMTRYSTAVTRFKQTYHAWAGVSLDSLLNLPVLGTSPVDFDMTSHAGPTQSVAKWVSVRLLLNEDDNGNAFHPNTPVPPH